MKIRSFKFFPTRSKRITYKRDKKHYIDFNIRIGTLTNLKHAVINRFQKTLDLKNSFFQKRSSKGISILADKGNKKN